MRGAQGIAVLHFSIEVMDELFFAIAVIPLQHANIFQEDIIPGGLSGLNLGDGSFSRNRAWNWGLKNSQRNHAVRQVRR